MVFTAADSSWRVDDRHLGMAPQIAPDAAPAKPSACLSSRQLASRLANRSARSLDSTIDLFPR
ncbi:MAG TPA: hypothetical protein VH328_04110, partial [Burkholderiaceae bacterium]|nr:hypothetical protein [Burkholderiaceae bacterium]